MGPTGNSRGSSSKNTSKSSFNSLSIAGALQCTAGVVLVLNCSCGALKGGRSPLLHQNTTATLCHSATPGIVPGPFVVCFKKAKQLFRDLKSIQNLPENAHPSCWAQYLNISSAQQTKSKISEVFCADFQSTVVEENAVQCNAQCRVLQSVLLVLAVQQDGKNVQRNVVLVLVFGIGIGIGMSASWWS